MSAILDRTTRPTLSQWKHHHRRLRWERRLARAPYYRLGLLFLAINAAGWVALLTWRG